MTRRTLVTGLLLLVTVLLAADTLAWLALQRRLDRTLVRVTEQAAHAGWKLDAAPGRRGGWPLRATLTLAGPRLTGSTGGPAVRGLAWSGERVTAVLSPWHPGRITLLPAGPQVIAAAGSGLSRSLRFWGGTVELHLPLGREGPARVGFDATALHLALPGAGPDDVITIGHLQGELRWTLEAHALTLTLRDLVLPRGQDARSSGHGIPQAALELSLVGRTGNAADSLAVRLRDWRAGGGRLLLRQAELSWPDARIDASGQASLDGNLEPDGGFTIGMTGADALLDRLAQSGRLAASTVSAVRAVLGLIAAGRSPDGGGGKVPLSLWLTLHTGLLSLGQIPLLRIPPLAAIMPAAALDPAPVRGVP